MKRHKPSSDLAHPPSADLSRVLKIVLTKVLSLKSTTSSCGASPDEVVKRRESKKRCLPCFQLRIDWHIPPYYRQPLTRQKDTRQNPVRKISRMKE